MKEEKVYNDATHSTIHDYDLVMVLSQAERDNASLVEVACESPRRPLPGEIDERHLYATSTYVTRLRRNGIAVTVEKESGISADQQRMLHEPWNRITTHLANAKVLHKLLLEREKQAAKLIYRFYK